MKVFCNIPLSTNVMCNLDYPLLFLYLEQSFLCFNRLIHHCHRLGSASSAAMQ